MNLVKLILNHSFWLFVGNSIGRLTMFLTNIIAARILSQEIFGQFMMIRNTISMIETIITGSFSAPIIKRVAEVSSSSNKTKLLHIVSVLFTVNLIIAISFSLIFVYLTPFLVKYFFLNSTFLIYGFYIGSILLISTIASSLMQSFLIGMEEYRKIAVSGLFSSLISFPFSVFFIYIFGLYGTISGVVLYFTIDFIIKYGQLKKLNLSPKVYYKCFLIVEEGINLFNRSKYLFLSLIITSSGFWYARVMVISRTGDFENIAIFDAAFQWLSIIMIITGATTSVALPMISKSIRTNTVKKKVFYVNLWVNLLISLSIACLFIVFSKSIMSLYGENYIKGQTALMILSITSIFFTFSSLYSKWLISHDSTKIIVVSNFISLLSLLITVKYSSCNGFEVLSYGFALFYILNFLILSIYSRFILET